MDEHLITEGQKWFSEFEVEVRSLRYSVKLRGNAIAEFLDQEHYKWSEFLKELRTKPGGQFATLASIVSSFNEMKTHLDRVKSAVSSNSVPEIEKEAKRFKSKLDELQLVSSRLIYFVSPLGALLQDAYRMDPHVGDGIYRYFSRQYIAQNTWNELNGFLRAFAFETSLDSALKVGTERELELLSYERKEWQQRNVDVKSNFEDLKLELGTWKREFTAAGEGIRSEKEKQLDSLITSKRTELDNVAKEGRDNQAKLENTYRDFLQLEAPARYWKVRAQSYRKRGWLWMALTTVFTLLVIEPLFYILYNTPSAFHYRLLEGDPIAIKTLIVFALIVSFLTYLIRISARMALSSFHIERDAEERQQLTYVYLALGKEGRVDEKDKPIILQALFSRVDTGILKEDSAPTMPGVGAVVERLVRK